MIDYASQSLFSQNSIYKEYRIEVYTGDTLSAVITNQDLYLEQIELQQSLCTEDQLTFGSCEAAQLKFKVVNTVGTLKDKKLLLQIKPYGASTYLQIGEFYVREDTLSGDRLSRDITAYDKLYEIINADVSEWYSEVGLPLTMKEFRDAFFEYFGVTQETVTLVNDNMVITETVLSETILGKDVVSCICSGNGCMGQINNEGHFKYVFLNNPDTKSYGKNYKQGSLQYEDYQVEQITGLKFYSNKVTIQVGIEDNMYVMEDNFLFYDKIDTDLSPYVVNIYNIIKDTPLYRPIKANTYGDPCVEVGDMLSFTKSDGNTISTILMERTIKGVQALSDSFKTKGRQYYSYDLNSTNSQIRRLWNNTLVLQNEIYGARTYVYAHRNTVDYEITSLNETQIISITIATVDDTIPVFLATIPLVMSADGEVIFRYYVEGLPLENDEDTIYLTKGKQFVTLSNYFEVLANQHKTVTVTAQVKYRQSVEREQTAKIISLKDWIDNQSISVQTSGGVTTATFTYDYVEHPIDTTPPTATIERGTIRAMIFASGLASEEPWDGNLLIVEEAGLFNMEETGFINAVDTLSIGKITPTGDTASDVATAWDLIELTFAGASDTLTLNTYVESYRRVLENGDVRITEEEDVRYTEGE